MAALSPFSIFSRGRPSTVNSSFRSPRGIHIAMGPCQFQGNNGFRCACPSGEWTVSSSDSWSFIPCEKCGHPMEVHHDYGKHHLPLVMQLFCIKSLTDVLKTKPIFPRVPLDH